MLAAAMLLTNVYMQKGKYAEATKYARIVINSPHKLVMNEDLAMNSAFNKLRSIDDLDEVIYAQEYDNSINTSIRFLLCPLVFIHVFHLCPCFKVEFDLGFSTGRTNDDCCSIF